MLRYSAKPPETPESMRCEVERRRDLPDRFENGALEFVMSQLSPFGGCRHIGIGTETPLNPTPTTLCGTPAVAHLVFTVRDADRGVRE
ncbi:hypothetical protein GCM10009534_43530 [Kribbella sandramycini]